MKGRSSSPSVFVVYSFRDRYEMARQFVLPGRIMFLRPLKRKPHEKKKKRRHDAVWVNAEVCL